MLRKIITYFLILAVVLPVFTSPFFQKTVFAQTTKTTIETTDADGNTTTVTTVENSSSSSSSKGTGSAKTLEEYTKGMESPCTILSFGTRLCIGYIVSQVMYYTVFSPSYYIALMAGGIFNASIGFSLSGESFPTDKDSMIAVGWKMVRDMLNLFFIFILLYTAISTILQYGNTAKNAIVKIIIAAVLINFSLMMTKMIIDSSHILAWGFYDKIEERQITDKDGNKAVAPIIPEEITLKGITTKNLAGVFMAGFNPQRLNIPSNTTKDSVSKGASAAMADGSGILGIIWQAILIMILASALNFIVAFILFAGAIMFVIRVVVLWFTLLFSPLAFAGMIMPAFQKYSDQWWDALIKQAFFAPAFLFLFYLVTKMVNSGFLEAVIKGYKDAPSATILFFDTGGTIVVFFHFFVVGALLVGCLYLAQQMGAHGSGAMMKWGSKAGDWAKSKASGIATSPLRGSRYGLRYGGGAAGDAISEGKGWFSRTIRAIPGADIGLRKLGAMKKADEDKERKAAEKYAGTLSSAGRTSLDKDKERSFVGRALYGGGLFKPTREGYEKVIAKKRADKYEEENYYKNLAKLAKINDYVDSRGVTKKGWEKAKSMIIGGEEEKIDKEIKKATKNIVDAYKKATAVIENRIAKNAVNLVEQNSRLYKAIEDGETIGVIDAIKGKITKLEEKKNKINGQKMIMAKREKEREAIEKAVEKYEAKQETEKLGAKFSSSGAGGGRREGGGGKTPI